jgi:hypothetical protein
LITTLIAVPFFIDGNDGCTAFFSEVETVAFAAVRVRDFTGPETFTGITNVVVFVTSPFAFLTTLGVEDGDRVGVGLIEGFGVGVIIGVGDALGVGETEREGVGVGEIKIVGVSAGGTNTNPPPPKPPPLVPPPVGAVADGVVAVGVGDALGASVAVGEGVGDALGTVVAIATAVTPRLPDSVEKAEVPTPLVDVTLAEYDPVASEVKVENVSVISFTTRDTRSTPSFINLTVKESRAEPPLLVGGSQLTFASPAVPVPEIVGALIKVGVEGMITESDLVEVVPVVFAELIAVTVNSAVAPAVNPVNSKEVASAGTEFDRAVFISLTT